MCDWPEASQRCHYVLSLAPVAASNCSHAVALNPFDGEGLEREWAVDFLPQRCELINVHTLARSSCSDLNLALITQTGWFLMAVSQLPNGVIMVVPVMSGSCGQSVPSGSGRVVQGLRMSRWGPGWVSLQLFVEPLCGGFLSLHVQSAAL